MINHFLLLSRHKIHRLTKDCGTNAVRTPFIQVRERERADGRTGGKRRHPGWYSTEVIGNRLGKASAFDLHWKWGSERQIRWLPSSFKRLKWAGRSWLVWKQLPFSMNFGFRSSSELQGEVDPMGEFCGIWHWNRRFQTTGMQQYHWLNWCWRQKVLYCHVLESRRCRRRMAIHLTCTVIDFCKSSCTAEAEDVATVTW